LETHITEEKRIVYNMSMVCQKRKIWGHVDTILLINGTEKRSDSC
jgi:hypothetical protein